MYELKGRHKKKVVFLSENDPGIMVEMRGIEPLTP